MRSFADWVFDATVWIVEREGVKWDMLDWYHEASKHHKVIEGLDADNSRLVELALTMATKAENRDEHSRVIRLLDDIDEILSKAEMWFNYIVVGAVLLGFGSIVGGLVSPSEIFALPLYLLGIAFIGSGVGGKALWRVWKHQIRTNVDLMNRYNARLTERPGAVRRHDREWELLASKYIWNRSLCNPKILHAIILLTILKLVSPKIYGKVSGDMRHTIHDFMEMDAREILRHQLDRIPEEIQADMER